MTEWWWATGHRATKLLCRSSFVVAVVVVRCGVWCVAVGAGQGCGRVIGHLCNYHLVFKTYPISAEFELPSALDAHAPYTRPYVYVKKTRASFYKSTLYLYPC
jgi:hypothetical protein